MDALPTGTVTLVFTDIEGSTAALTRLADRWGPALAAHRKLLRAAFTRAEGHELGTEGDSFFVVFASAPAAVAACIEAQRALAARPWPDDVPLRVRVGVHTGTPTRHEDGYIGLDVHVGARIASAAHGGQVVLSAATRDLVADALPAGVRLRDVGLHRLKDLTAPLPLHDLVIDGLPHDFPPLRSLGAVTNLPATAMPLVGRAAELERVAGWLTGAVPRLVTVAGAGGAGKTRLALAAGRATQPQFEDGTYFVDLSAATDTDRFWSAVADALGGPGTGRPVDRALARVEGWRALVVLDNAEQVHGVEAAVARLLRSAPALALLVTSRRPLRLADEQVLPLAPLPTADAVELFLQRASAVRPGLSLDAEDVEAVEAICRRLDGLPLAIELAAARTRLLSPVAVLRRLSDRLDLVDRSGARPPRQRTLRDTIAWSYQLLSADLRRAFTVLGVTAGGCDLEALESLTAPGAEAALDVAEELAEASLVTVGTGTDREPRFGLLSVVREFALEQLAADGEADAARARHAEHFALIAERYRRGVSVGALDRLEEELENFREALRWCLQDDVEDPGRARLGLRIVDALATFWYRHGHGAEGHQWLERALDRHREAADEGVGDALHGLGVLLQQEGDRDTAEQLLHRALTMWRARGDQYRAARELNSLGVAAFGAGDLARARELVEDSLELARGLGAADRVAAALTNLALITAEEGRPAEGVPFLHEAQQLDEAAGDQWGVTVDRINTSALLAFAGRLDDAETLLDRTAPDVAALGDADLLVEAVELRAVLHAERGRPLEAARLAGAAERTRRDIAVPMSANDRDRLERYLSRARATVPDQQWRRAWADGASSGPGDLVALLDGAVRRGPGP